MNSFHTINKSRLIINLIYTKSLLNYLQIAGLRGVEVRVLCDQLMMIPVSSAVGEGGGQELAFSTELVLIVA